MVDGGDGATHQMNWRPVGERHENHPGHGLPAVAARAAAQVMGGPIPDRTSWMATKIPIAGLGSGRSGSVTDLRELETGPNTISGAGRTACPPPNLAANTTLTTTDRIQFAFLTQIASA